MGVDLRVKLSIKLCMTLVLVLVWKSEHERCFNDTRVLGHDLRYLRLIPCIQVLYSMEGVDS